MCEHRQIPHRRTISVQFLELLLPGQISHHLSVCTCVGVSLCVCVSLYVSTHVGVDLCVPHLLFTHVLWLKLQTEIISVYTYAKRSHTCVKDPKAHVRAPHLEMSP